MILTNPPFGGTENVDAIRDNFRYPSSAEMAVLLPSVLGRPFGESCRQEK